MADRHGSVRGVLTIEPERLTRLRSAAQAARRLTYARYSGAIVLAAAELKSGTITGGSNIECVNLSLTKHAEEVAIIRAFAEESEAPARGRLVAVYVAGLSPCGSCRQFAAEFATEDAIWVIDRVSQRELLATSLSKLTSDRDPQIAAFGDYLPDALLDYRQ